MKIGRWAWIITLAREYSIILEQRAQVFRHVLKRALLCRCALIRSWGQAASAAPRSPDLDKPNKERVDTVCKCVCWSSCDAVLSPPVPFFFFLLAQPGLTRPQRQREESKPVNKVVIECILGKTNVFSRFLPWWLKSLSCYLSWPLLCFSVTAAL